MLSTMKSEMKSLMLWQCCPCEEIRHGSEGKLKKEVDMFGYMRNITQHLSRRKKPRSSTLSLTKQ